MTRSVYSALVWLVLLPVHVYRVALSPLKRAPSCRYLPTCSEYAINAVRQRGIFVGLALAVWRIVRCNPLGAGGYDPVPPARRRPSGPIRDGESPFGGVATAPAPGWSGAVGSPGSARCARHCQEH